MELNKFIQIKPLSAHPIDWRSASFWSSLFMVLTVFAIPISSTVRSITMNLSVLFLLLNPEKRRVLHAIVRKYTVRMAFVLFAFSTLACVWSNANLHEQWIVLEKYSKLLYLPFFILIFQHKPTRTLAIHAFLLSMLITCVLLLLKAAGLVHYGGQDPGEMFRNHIMTGYMMVFAAYLAAYLACYSTQWRLLYGILCCLFSYQILFLGTGRMAYLAYALLAGLWFFQIFSWRKACLLLGLGAVLFSGIYTVNPTLQFLTHQVRDDWGLYHQNKKDTSLGFRLQFHTYAYDLFKRRPWLGHGTGGFTHAFNTENPVEAWRISRDKPLLEPHSQYWLVAAELGWCGLLILLLFFLSIIKDAWGSKLTRDLSCALLLPLLIGNFTDSLLLYSGTGYFFLLFIGLSLASTPQVSHMLYKKDEAMDAVVC